MKLNPFIKTSILGYYSLLAIIYLVMNVPEASSFQKQSSAPVSFRQKLETLLNHNELSERISFGFYDYAGDPPLIEINSQELKVYGSMKIDYKTQTPFVDKSSGKTIICCMEYHYTMDECTFRDICKEFLTSGFFTDKFDEERVFAGLDETTFRTIFLTIDNEVVTKKFMFPMNPERQKKLERDYYSLLQRGFRIDGVGVAKKLAKLQYLFNCVIDDRNKDVRCPKGSVYIFDWSKGPIPFDFQK
jgi:hypothetical protein